MLRPKSILTGFLTIVLISPPAYPGYSGITYNDPSQRVTFPGTKTEAKSPDGRYMIRNTDDQTRQPVHMLSLVETKTHHTIMTYSYDRNVDVLWSPDSSAFVINDHEGSDSTRPLLYSLPWGDKKTDLLEELTDFLRKQHNEKLVLKNDHVYLSVRRWEGPRQLLCLLEAYGEASPRDLKAYYIYSLKRGFQSHHE
jgi:hypothetical protein